ncbi:FecR family protein [Thermophagus sp. OGC60D27]|uniref:FecR family protein n=1 Tax=Thermophagus sp. OGC60D27 TaxID=3458415 RepID=UPI004037CCDB
MEKQFLNIVSRNTTLNERFEFFKELENNPEKKKDFMTFQKLWILFQMENQQLPTQKKGEYFQKFWASRQPTVRIGRWQLISGIAAMVTLIIGLGSVVMTTFFTTPHEEQFVLQSPKGNITYVTLKDGSKLWLNSASSVTVTTYDDEKIVVDLKGEAFFDVTHHDEREFLVKTGDYYIVDQGTTFNVKYNLEEKIVITSLFEGSIDFRNKGRALVEKMQPGKEFVFDMQKNKLAFSNTDKEYVTAWKDGKFVFVNRTFSEIANELEEWYDVQFVFKNQKIKNEKFSGVMKRKTSIEHLLKVLQLSSKSKYRIEEMENGKQKIIFE